MLIVAELIGGRSFPLAAEAMIATVLAGRDEDLGVIQAFLDEASAGGAGLAIRAAGRTNKQIGERLYLSHWTVAGHLNQIFPRLGITSRATLSPSAKPRW